MQYVNDFYLLSTMANKTTDIKIETSDDIFFCMFLLGLVTIFIIVMMYKLKN